MIEYFFFADFSCSLSSPFFSSLPPSLSFLSSLLSSLPFSLSLPSLSSLSFLSSLENGPEVRGLALHAFLIKPVQRICKYPLLLRDLIRNTDSDHPDRQNLITVQVNFSFSLFPLFPSLLSLSCLSLVSLVSSFSFLLFLFF